MEWDTSAIAAGFWVAFGAAIWAGVRAIINRLVVSTDDVQKKFLDSLRADLDKAIGMLQTLDTRQGEQGAKIAFIEGVMQSCGRRIDDLMRSHDGR